MIVDQDIAYVRAWPGHAALAAATRGAAPAVLAASAVSAVALWLSSRSGIFGWLAWVALVPVAVVVLSHGSGRLRRLAVPLTFGLYLELLVVPALPFGIAHDQWGEPPLPVLVGDSPVLLAALGAVPAVTALLWAVGFGQPWRRSGPAAAIVAGSILGPAIAWTALDFVRVKLDPAGLWGPAVPVPAVVRRRRPGVAGGCVGCDLRPGRGELCDRLGHRGSASGAHPGGGRHRTRGRGVAHAGGARWG